MIFEEIAIMLLKGMVFGVGVIITMMIAVFIDERMRKW
jgi:hypothetical protein